MSVLDLIDEGAKLAADFFGPVANSKSNLFHPARIGVFSLDH